MSFFETHYTSRLAVGSCLSSSKYHNVPPSLGCLVYHSVAELKTAAPAAVNWRRLVSTHPRERERDMRPRQSHAIDS